MKELWKIVDFSWVKPYYAVSNCGRVKNLKTRKFLTPSKDKGGYLTIGLAVKVPKGSKKKQKRILLHRLVGLMFIPNPEPFIRTTINHIDGNKENNMVDNLEWMSNSDNVKDMYEKGRHPTKRGVDIPNNKYTEKQIRQVCELLTKSVQNKKIFELTGVPTNIIGFIKRRKLWCHISKDYDFEGPKEKVKYAEYFVLFDGMIRSGMTWADAKKRMGLHGKWNTYLRELYHKREKKILSSSTTIQMTP